jgi:hypothetical protein
VTDGTSFWVVDGSALKVFKYTLSGSLLGSWKIDPADTHPTGITINPNNVSDIWIADNGTDKVYQYVGAATRTSGSQSAAATFALAAGNTNPQGIADPPPADLRVMPATAPASASALDSAATPSQAPTGAAIPAAIGPEAPGAIVGGDLVSRVKVALLDLATDGTSAVQASGWTPLVDRIGTPGGVWGDWDSGEWRTPLTPAEVDAASFDRVAAGQLDRVPTAEEDPLSAAALDTFFAFLRDPA